MASATCFRLRVILRFSHMVHHSDFSAELLTAIEVATLAADLVRDVYHHDFSIEWKAERDPVTEADRRANALVVSFLRQRFPHDSVCSEEDGTEANLQATTKGGRCWFVDPLDGTADFIKRIPEFSVMVGLAIDGVARVGAIVNPLSRERFYGEIGLGAFTDDSNGPPRLLAAPTEADPRHAQMLTSRSHLSHAVISFADTLGVASHSPCGSIGIKVSRITSGLAQLYITHSGPKLWDACAPEALAVAAGLAFTDLDGKPIRYDSSSLALENGIVVCPRAMLDRVIAVTSLPLTIASRQSRSRSRSSA